MSNIGTKPPSAVNEPCIALTAPHDVSVVIVANSADAAMPKRASLPSQLPPATPSACTMGLPAASAAYAAVKPATNSVVIRANRTHPCRGSRTTRPHVYVSAPPLRNMQTSSMRLLRPVGFSHGDAEFAL